MRTNPTVGDRQDIVVTVPAGGAIAGTLWLPAGGPRAVVVVHPATATPERYYAGFGTFVTANDCAAITYDYRGTGRSGTPRANKRLRMRDWMSQDVPAVAEWVGGRLPDVPQVAVGHSLGGHALALNHGTGSLRAFATVASHAGVTRTIPSAGERRRVALVLDVLGPTLARTIGYMPGRRLGLGEDFPAAAMLEWSGWSRRPGYFFDDLTMDAAARAAAVVAPVLALGASDDPWATPRQIEAITDRLTSTTVTRRTYTPAELGATRVGHHGLLRRGVGERAWPALLEWLLQHVPAERP
ncbi:alpha/beta hydrolase family protein [Polymorphospora rubra]|uniref:alpha/beta hydrolase family protein n=1 Tax=Polymorphospora rubra TaxID=338584 RepID=UPI0033CC42DC